MLHAYECQGNQMAQMSAISVGPIDFGKAYRLEASVRPIDLEHFGKAYRLEASNLEQGGS